MQMCTRMTPVNFKVAVLLRILCLRTQQAVRWYAVFRKNDVIHVAYDAPGTPTACRLYGP